jgi:hypothetical protein
VAIGYVFNIIIRPLVIALLSLGRDQSDNINNGLCTDSKEANKCVFFPGIQPSGFPAPGQLFRHDEKDGGLQEKQRAVLFPG